MSPTPSKSDPIPIWSIPAISTALSIWSTTCSTDAKTLSSFGAASLDLDLSIRKLNDYIASDNSVDHCLLTIYDGMTLCVKK